MAVKYADGFVQYDKHQFKLWDSYGLIKYSARTGSFVEDRRGRCYVCLVVNSSKQKQSNASNAIGVTVPVLIGQEVVVKLTNINAKTAIVNVSDLSEA